MPVLKKKKVYSSRWWAIRLGWLENGAFLRPKRLLLLFVTGLEDFQREFTVSLSGHRPVESA